MSTGKKTVTKDFSCFGRFAEKGAGASEAPGQTKEEFSINDTSRDPKVLKIGPQHG